MRIKDFLLIILLFPIIGGCDTPARPIHGMFRWKETSSPEFDSTNLCISMLTYRWAPFEERYNELIHLKTLADSLDDTNMKEIAEYWHFRTIYHSDEVNNSVLDSVRSLISRCDSIERPFNYYMLIHLLGNFEKDNVKKYLLYHKALKWFQSQEDYLNVGMLYTHLSVIYYDGNNMRHNALWSLKQADEAYKKSGAELYRLKNLLNIAHASKDAKEIDSIYRHLIANPLLKDDPGFYQALKYNYYNMTDSLDLLNENISFLRLHPDLKNELAYSLTARANRWLREDSLHNAVSLMNEARNLIDTNAEPFYHSYITEVMAGIYKKRNMSDSALYYTEISQGWKDSIARKNNLTELSRVEASHKIAEIENRWQMREQQIKLIIWISVFTLILGIVTWGFFHYKKIKEKEIKALKTEAELARSRTSLAAKNVIITEKNSTLLEMKENLNKLVEEKRIPETEAKELLNRIKIHLSTEPERASFLNQHDQLDPVFIKGLREEFPELTESQLRLCSYIALGMTNPQISQMLNISRDSLKVLRSRLRKKLKLNTADSLEEFLSKKANFS